MQLFPPKSGVGALLISSSFRARVDDPRRRSVGGALELKVSSALYNEL